LIIHNYSQLFYRLIFSLIMFLHCEGWCETDSLRYHKISPLES